MSLKGWSSGRLHLCQGMHPHITRDAHVFSMKAGIRPCWRHRFHSHFSSKKYSMSSMFKKNTKQTTRVTHIWHLKKSTVTRTPTLHVWIQVRKHVDGLLQLLGWYSSWI